jgi:hypothetical protein
MPSNSSECAISATGQLPGRIGTRAEPAATSGANMTHGSQ